MFQKRTPKILIAPDAPFGLVHPLADLSNVVRAKVRHFNSRDIGPEIFHRVQVRSVRRQEFRPQPLSLRANIIARNLALVRRKRIPDQKQFSPAHKSLQAFQIFDDVRTSHGTILGDQKQANATAGCGRDQSPDSRQPFPAERLSKNRRFTAWRPCPTHGRPLRKATLVQKPDEPVQFSDFFLKRGQRSFIHCLTALLLRSRACRSGFWQLHPRSPKRRQTC